MILLLLPQLCTAPMLFRYLLLLCKNDDDIISSTNKHWLAAQRDCQSRCFQWWSWPVVLMMGAGISSVRISFLASLRLFSGCCGITHWGFCFALDPFCEGSLLSCALLRVVARWVPYRTIYRTSVLYSCVETQCYYSHPMRGINPTKLHHSKPLELLSGTHEYRTKKYQKCPINPGKRVKCPINVYLLMMLLESARFRQCNQMVQSHMFQDVVRVGLL